MMATYDKLLHEIELRFKIWRESASNYIPRMAKALIEEEHLEPQDVRERILKDCIQFWARKTIIDNLPPECKEAERAEWGRKGGSSKKKKQQKEEKEIASKLEASDEQEIVVDARGSAIEEKVPSKTIAEIVTPPSQNKPSNNTYEQDVTQELLETKAALKVKEQELEDLRNEIKRLSQGLSALILNVKNSPAFRELQEQMKALEKENEELRDSIAQATKFTSAKEQEMQLYEGTIPNAKLSELFVVIRSSITKKRDVVMRFSADHKFLFAQGVDSQ